MPTSNERLGLDFLLVSKDDASHRAVRSALDNLGSNLHIETSAEAAVVHSSRHRLDGAIFDLDLQSGGKLISLMREKGPNRRVFAFICASKDAESATALQVGANVVLQKPLNATDIAANIRSLRAVIGRERRSYFRHHVTIPVSLKVNFEQRSGMIDNLSQGGMAVMISDPPARSTAISFSFELPFGPRVEGDAQVMWSNEKGLMGVQFRTLRGKSNQHLTEWLTRHSLEPA